MKRIFTHLFVAVLLMLSATSWAQFENGKVYRIVCSGTTSVSLGASALTDVAAVSTSETDKSQQWYVTVSRSNYTFRNLANGRYLQGNNTTSGGWSLTETSNNFTVSTVSNNYCIRQTGHSNGYAYMHKDAGNNIVSWESNAGNSQWTPIEVSYTTSELDAVWAKVESIVVPSATVASYEEKLSAIFTDKACTQLNSTYAAKTVDQIKADDNYLALPATLQSMVLKVKGGDWTESTVAPADRPNGNNNTNHSLWTVSDTWNNDYAKRFRVQMYEPYSIEGEITSYLRFNAHCNMDNPTGIYADGGEPIYIMVEGTIEEGAELWIAHQTGHGATGYYSNATYTRLHEGLNVVPFFNDGSQLWINYLVHTYNGNGATIAEKFPHKLSDYKPLKIHIEGGRINGYYNAIGDFRATDSGTENLWGEVDNDEDWNYYKARVALSTDFALLGHRQTPLFPFGTYESGKGAFCTYNDGGGLEYALAYHLDNITVPTVPNCYGGSGNTFGTFAGSYSGMNLDASNGKINIMLEAWDRIMYSELATMGLVSTSTMNKMNSLYPRWTSEGTAAEIYNYGSATVNGETKTYKEFCLGIDYSEYFNHHGAGVGAPSGYMSGGWRVCNYHYNTMGSVIGKIAAEAGPTWGPAHEIGHQHQGVFNLNGQTEVTNNFFSNVAVWYMGMGTSRVNGSEGSLASVLGAFNTDGNDLYTNNIWAITHLYYRLWLYYHLAGNNTQFWPRLFELCRQVPLENGGQISGETSLLRFYQHACDAAGEDLTEFFRAHGFFEIMDNRLVGDYSNATYNITQEQIDAAIKSVKDKGYPVNYAALLINDATSETTVKHDGATKRSLWDGSATADLGSVNDFIDGDIETLTNYTATVSADGTVTMSGGEGGIGFLVLNEDGELVSFSNKTEFALNDEAAYLLATGKATIVAVDTDSETAEAEVDLSAIQREMLKALIEKIEAMPIDDGTYTHIGFYTKACAADLLAALESAKTVLASGTGFAAAYELLYTEKEKFVNSPSLSYVPFDPSLTYIITNYAYKDKTMYLSSGVRSNTGVDKTLDTSKWQFKTTGTDGVYNLYNVSGNYLAAASKSTLVASVSDQASAATYSLIQDSPVGTWAISVSPAAEFATLHDNSYGNVVGWEAGASASKWYLTAVEGSTNSQATQNSDELQALIAKAETLMNEVATVSLKGKVQLQADNANSAFYITSNATEAGHEPKYLLDNNVTTFFHTVWTGTSPGADHYLQIDLGEELPIDQFVLKYTNLPSSSWNVDAANTIKVQGANILDEFTNITTLTDLPTEKEGTYTSATLGAKGTNYRYIRLTVTNATGGKFDNHYYFGMSEFSLERLNSYSKVKDAYTGHITQGVVATVADKLVDAKTVIANGGDIATAKAALQEAYDALLLEYNGVADAKKKELQDLIDATNELIAQVGEATVIAGANVDLLGKLYAEKPYTAGGTSHSDYSSAENGYNLLDGNVNTHFHSDYNTSSMFSPPYLRVDLGKGNSARKVNFNYTTRNQTGCAPTKINVYGGVAGVEYSQGAIQSSAALNAVTAPTKIVIKNLSGTNSKYFAGTSNVDDINAAVLVWEPVTEGEAGRYYLRTTDAENGYIQKGSSAVQLGTNANAQVFVTTAPSASGTDATYFNNETLVNADLNNLVRFVQEGGSTWLNCQSGDSDPVLGHTGKGGWTVHNVYLVTETENDTPSYDATPIATFTSSDATNQLPTGTSEKWTSTDIASTKDYRFFKFEVAESQGSNSGGYYFAISEFVFNIVGEYSVTINPEYQGLVSEDLLIETRQEVDAAVTMKNIATSEDLLQAQIDKLQAAYDALEKAKNTPADLDKAALQSLYGDALQLYNEMADGEGNVNDNYRPSALTNEKLAEAKTVLDAAKTALDSSNLQSEIDDAKTALQAQYDALLEIKNANVATTIDKSGLRTAITNANALIAAIEAKGDGYYESVAGFGLAELSFALQNAETVVDRFYLTEAQYNETLTQLNNCYTTTNGIVALDCNSENRNNLSTLIGNVNALLTVIADAGETTVALPLQSTKADAAFYIWCNEPAGDSNGVAGLIDKNSDGTANIGTFLGTDWENDVDAYTHYIEIDLGVAGTIDQLTMDYTTRNSTHADQRPNAIKILGSNDKANYNEITEITSGLAANANEKWSMGELLDLGGRYRYIRVAVGSQRGFFHMSDFNLYTKLSHTLKEYYTTAEGLDLVTLCLVLDEAQDAAARYMTAEQCNAVYNKLEGCYTTANAIASNDYSDRDELATLKTAASTLVNDVVSIDETEAVIALQCDDENAPYYIFCNAPEKSTTYPGDNLGVAALLDVDVESGDPITSTHLHTAYSGNDTFDDLDHYLRVDIGESNLLSFKFAYIPRSNTNNAPTVMLIEGCNDLESGEWEEITTIADLPATSYQSGEITNGKAYRYVRFMVTATVNNDMHNGHPFFAMSHFEMTACKTVAVDAEHQSPYLPVGVLSAAYNELVDARVFDAAYYFPSEEGEVIKSELQNAYNALVDAVEYCWLPVKLTTDENNPVLYTINAIGRGDGKAWQYNMDNNNVTIVNKDAANFYHLWYFVAGDTEHTVKIVPVMTPAYRLDCGDYSNGANKINAGPEGVEWEFVRSATNEYNFKPTGQNIYLSNFGGGSNPLGFYGSVDGGSQVNFTEVVVEDYGLDRLSSFANSLTQVASGTTVGSFVQETGDIFNRELAGSIDMIEDANYGNDAYAASFANLFNAYHNLEIIMPQAGTENAPVLYTITNVGRVGGKMFAGGETEPVLCWDNNTVTAKYIFTFEPTDEKGKYYMKSLERGTYVSTALGHGSGIEKIAADKDNAKIVTIANMSSGSRAVSITPADGAMLHADGSGNANKVVAWDNNEANNASAWLIDEVTDLSQVTHTVTMNATFSSVMLGYNATVPAGVEAYNAEGVEGGYVSLVEVARAGEVIPANTPVILYRTDNNTSKTFTYTTTAADVPTETVLGGSLYQKFVRCDSDKDYYKLMIKGGEAKMYWMYKEFNAAGESLGSTNDGGHIKCSANKIYMALPQREQAASFGMRFKEPETTSVDEVKTENGEVKTIYDLQGRKLTEITEPGFYIINGKKVYVK